jgi:hypothetical protein
MTAGPRFTDYTKSWLLISGSGVRNPDGAQVRGYFDILTVHTGVLTGTKTGE